MAVALVFSLVGCRSKVSVTENPSSAVPSASASAQAPLPVIPPEQVHAVLNPNSEAPYSGPIGTVRGVVHASGDAAPTQHEVVDKIPPGHCDDARAFYGKLFREGLNRELGDVLVAVTNYKGYVPPSEEKRVIVAKGCAFDSRTVATVFGQRLEISDRGTETFLPELVGSGQPAVLAAVPGGDAIKLYPNHVGQFTLIDRAHAFAKADVFVLKYPTAAVTGLDGKFEIKGIPAGEVLVTAYLPATRVQASKRLTVVAGETADLDLTVPFTAAGAAPAPSASP